MQNSRRNFLKNLAATATGMAFLNIPEKIFASEDLARLSILHTNDIHCHIDPFPKEHKYYKGKGGMARLSGLVKRIKSENPNTLLFDAGDMFQGTPYFNYYKGELMLKVMSAMGYDASTIGNHEFDNGIKGILDPIYHADFPLICSNYDFSNTLLYGKFPNHVIFRKGGIKVGVYGLGIELKGLVSPDNYAGTIYNDPVKVALEKESFLKNEKKCNLIICLSHLGFKYRENKVSDNILASETHYTNLIIGGHTHTFLDKPVELKNADGKKILVNQAGWGGMMLGRIDFIFDRNKKDEPVIFAQNVISG